MLWMSHRIRTFFAALTSAAASLVVASSVLAQTPIPAEPDTPFKLASFGAAGKVRLGLVLAKHVLDIGEANEHLIQRTGVSRMTIPDDMRGLIEEYDRVSSRLYQIANFFGDLKLEELDFAFLVDEASLKAPIKYPYNLLAAAANYRSHAAEMDVARAIDPDRDDPYLFAKSPRSCIIDPGEPFVIPPGRKRIDWEGELAVVMGAPATRVSLHEALDHVFGFTIMYDVSDRGGGTRANPTFPGPDWFSGKSRDGAAPMGPFIVPKEFLPNHANLRLVTRVNDRMVQDARTSEMIYDIEHLIRYITSIMTLYPGDVISTGTPDGVGAARKPPEFLKPGDVVSIEIEGIGTLKTPIQAASSAPTRN
ncbi:MAG: fumarylacetoacetate hydrolase family protein, partial [Acidobacteriota bacterium]